MKAEIKTLELLMDPEDSEVCLRYTLTHAQRRGSRIFEVKSLVGARRKEDNVTRKVTKRVTRCKLRRNNGKDVSASRKKDEDTDVAAEFFVNKGGRKLMEFCGR